MTTPSIRYKCPKCGKVELHIIDRPQYCSCPGKGKTERGWTPGTRWKSRTIKRKTGTRMVKVNA